LGRVKTHKKQGEMVRTGFSSTAIAPSDDGNDRISEIEERSIPIEELKYDTVTIGDYADDEPLQLPIGIFLDGEDEDAAKQRVVDFTIRPGVETGDFDEFLAKLDPKQGENGKKAVDTIALFLGGGRTKDGYHLGAIESMGGIEFREFAQKAGQSSGEQLIRNMYLGDVATLMFGTRLKIGGRDFAVDRECPFPGCRERCRSVQNLNTIKIKSIPGLEDRPLFKFTLRDGMRDGRGLIKNVYLQPIKLYQLGLFASAAKVADIEMMVAMIAEIPESEVYGKKKGNPFCMDLYKTMSSYDINALRQATVRLTPGPVAVIEGVECACGEETFPHQLNWARTPRNFLYQSSELVDEDL
jgi:hypothetical protein